jgi:hypothetical protein
VLLQQRLCFCGLQRREAKLSVRIAVNDEVDAAVAEVATSVEKNYAAAFHEIILRRA